MHNPQPRIRSKETGRLQPSRTRSLIRLSPTFHSPLVANAVGDGGGVSVVGPVLVGHAADVEGALVVLAAALVRPHVAVQVAEGGGEVIVAAPLGPGQYEELLEDPPPPPVSTPPSHTQYAPPTPSPPQTFVTLHLAPCRVTSSLCVTVILLCCLDA